MAGFFFGDNAPDSYEARERNRKLAEAMMQQGMDYSPVKSWTQGASRLAQALVGGYEAGKYDKKDKEASDAYNKLAMSLFGGGASAPPVTPSTAMTSEDAGAAPSPMTASGGANLPGDMSAWAAAIKKKESAGSGDYAAVGPTHPKLGRALGAYQVMEANIGPWSREALGREVTPEEFLRNPQIQDQIFQHKFGQYVQKFGNPQDAASAWFTGRPLAQGANARDVLGTTGAQYVSDFNRNIGQPQGAAPVQVASLGGVTPDGMPTSPVPSNAPPMAYAPAQQAIAGASPPPAAPRGQQLAQAVSAPPIPAPQPTGNVQAAMMAILSDPRFSPQQKNQALMMYQMGQGKADYDFQVAGDRLFRVNKRTGQAEPIGGVNKQPTGDLAGYEQARKEGFSGTFLDYQKTIRQAAAARNEGAPPQGFRYVRDANGNIERLEPIPGSKEARAEAAREEGQKKAAQNVVSVIDDIEKSMKDAVLPTTGGVGPFVARIGGTAANDVRRNIDTIKASVSFEKLNEMRAQSPTGGALGSVTERELELLGASLRNLEQSQSDAQFRRNLQAVKDTFMDVIHGPGKRPGADAPIRRRYDAQGNLQ